MSTFKYYLFLILLIILLTNSYELKDVHFLISAKLNGTSPYISFKNLKPNQIYQNFLFDFEYHNNHVKESKNLAYFKLSTNLDIPTDEELTKNSISYRLSGKKWTFLKKSKFGNNIMYKKVPILFKEKKDNIYNYYFKIQKNDDIKKTLIIKAPIKGKKEGFLSIENILELPSIPKLRNLVENGKEPDTIKMTVSTNKYKYNNKNKINNNNRYRNINRNNNYKTNTNTYRYRSRIRFKNIFKRFSKVNNKINKSITKFFDRLKKNIFYTIFLLILVILWAFILIIFFIQNRKKVNPILRNSSNFIEMNNINQKYIRLNN